MLGWTIQFFLFTMLSAAWSSFAGQSGYWPARAAFALFGGLLMVSVFCMVVGKAVRNSLR
jgi:hypothetical protein